MRVLKMARAPLGIGEIVLRVGRELGGDVSDINVRRRIQGAVSTHLNHARRRGEVEATGPRPQLWRLLR